MFNKKEYDKQYYEENKEKIKTRSAKQRKNSDKEKVSEYNKQYKKDNKEAINNYFNKIKIRIKNIIALAKKEQPCSVCKKIYPSCVLDFHHLDPKNKLFDLAKAYTFTIHNDVVLQEIDKCILICAVCHRDETFSGNVKRYKTLANEVNKNKNKPCEMCKIQYKPWQMDFNHLDKNNKLYSISYMVSIGKPLAEILAEINKCELLCANCHRIKTYTTEA